MRDIKLNIFQLILFTILVFISLTSVCAAKPSAPVISVLKNNTLLSIAWSPVANAQNYQLFYAPFPFLGVDTIASVNLGDTLLFSAELLDGDAFYVTVVANNNEGSSDFSNIELFFISTVNLDSEVLAVTAGDWYKPELSISWQWQLNGVVNEDYQVSLFDIDLFDAPGSLINNLKISGKKVICYFSAGSYENFRADVDKFNTNELGNTLDGFPDERWLDIRSENIANIMTSRLDMAVLKGCDGVEPDNMDAYVNDSGFDLTANDQLAFNKFIANEAHKRGLSVGLKNDLDQIQLLVNFFDFHVNEQCYEFNECDTLKPFIDAGKPVLNVEYQQLLVDDEIARDTLCKESQLMQFSSLVLPLDLDDTFRFSCNNI